MTSTCRRLALLIAFLSPVAFAAGSDVPSIDDILNAADLTRYRSAIGAGKIVWLSAPGSEPESSAVAGVMMSSYPAAIADLVHVMATDTRISDSLVATIDGSSTQAVAAAFEPVRLKRSEQKDIAFLLNPRATGDFNYSANEIEQLDALVRQARQRQQPQDDAALASELLRGLMRERYLQYIERGVAGIAPYQRPGGSATDSAFNLKAATDSYRVIQRYFPRFYAALQAWPRNGPDGYQHTHSWFRDTQGGRPLFVIKHAMQDIGDDYALIVERQYYISHTLDNLQVVMLMLPDGDRTALIILTQTSTAKVDGMGRVIAAPIGRHMVRRNVEPIFTALKRHFGD